MFNLVEFFGMEEGKLYLSAYCIKDNDHANYVGEAFAELVESNASNWEVGKSFGGLVNVQKMDKLIRAFQKGNINTVNKIKGEISESFFKFAYRVQK